jgi:DNA-binding Xre family transcriptional regulator
MTDHTDINLVTPIADPDDITPADMREEAEDLATRGQPWECVRCGLAGRAEGVWVLLAPSAGRAGVCEGGVTHWYDAVGVAEAIDAHFTQDDSPEPPDVPARLRRLLDENGWTDAEVARRCGMSRQQVHRLVSGAVPNPGVLTLARLLGPLGLTVSDLFPDEG